MQYIGTLRNCQFSWDDRGFPVGDGARWIVFPVLDRPRFVYGVRQMLLREFFPTCEPSLIDVIRHHFKRLDIEEPF